MAHPYRPTPAAPAQRSRNRLRATIRIGGSAFACGGLGVWVTRLNRDAAVGLALCVLVLVSVLAAAAALVWLRRREDAALVWLRRRAEFALPQLRVPQLRADLTPDIEWIPEEHAPPERRVLTRPSKKF